MKLEMCFLLLTTSMAMISTVSAQSSCTNVLFSMAPCLEYITRNTSSPSQPCCSQFAHVVQNSPQCLCEVLNGGGALQLGIKVNETQALTLPKACNVQTPPASRCKEHESGSKPVQGDKTSSDGSSIKFSLLPLLTIFFTASYINIFAKILTFF